MRIAPDFTHEDALRTQGALRIAGVDEVGRGPLAGPVVAAAVILDPARIPPGLYDSKRMTPRAREKAALAIRESASVGLGEASVEEIEELNILRATHLAMARALAALGVAPDHALIDGTAAPSESVLPRPGRSCAATRGASPSRRPRSWPRCGATGSWSRRRNSIPAMAGRPTWATDRKATCRRYSVLGPDPTSIGAPSPRSTRCCGKRKSVSSRSLLAFDTPLRCPQLAPNQSGKLRRFRGSEWQKRQWRGALMAP